MSSMFRITTVACVSAAIVAIASGPAAAQFTDDQLKCRAAIAKSGTKMSKSILKVIALCHKNRNTDLGLDGTDCNDLVIADIDSKVVTAVEKFTTKVTGTCTGQTPSAMLYEGCPTPCSNAVPAIADIGDLTDCLVCVTKAELEGLAEAVYTEPDPVLEKDVANCHKSITTNSSKLLASILKTISKCQADAEKDGAITVTNCTQTAYDSLVLSSTSKYATSLETGKCAGVTLPDTTLDACGSPSTIAELVACVIGGTDSTSQTLVTALLELPAENVTTTSTTSTTTTTLPPADPLCPATADLASFARSAGVTCMNNGDCTGPYTCNGGKCSSPTDSDLGWAGYAHDNDTNTGDLLRLSLNCEGPADPGCGTCTVTGVDPAAGNCRCANDSRVICTEPLAASAAECGGAACECYLETPTPISISGTPLCMVRRLASEPGGTLDVDSGALDLDIEVRQQIHLGLATITPCPRCGGTCTDNPTQVCDRDSDCNAGTCTLDPVANDGLRGGTCTAGASVGLSCDVTSTNASFPAYPLAEAPNGGGYSLDCMPNINVSGAGVRLDLDVTTGASSLPNDLSCGPLAPELDCPCLVCSGDTAVACSSDSDCSGQEGRCSLATGPSPARCDVDADCLGRDAGVCSMSIERCIGALSIDCTSNSDCDFVNLGTCLPSTCSSNGNGEHAYPNSCDGLACTDLGGGEGECTTGPDLLSCDGVLKADGSGVLSCQDDDACTPGNVGVDAGTCTLEKRLECFPAPVAASGSPSPVHPVAAAAYCMPPSGNAAVNSILGLPGPARSIQQLSLVSHCPNPSFVYTPGGGGCP